MTSLTVLDFSGKNIRFERRDDRVWVSLTDMAKATEKQVNDYTRSKSATEFLEELQSVMGTTVIETKRGGTPEKQGTWAIEEVAIDFNRWLSQSPSKKSSKIFECSIRDSLASKVQGETEVPCKAGVVDIVTPSEIIEVKKIQLWKSAIGQSLVYACEFKGLKPRIHLFGKASKGYKSMIISFCSKLSVSVTFEGD